MSDQPKKRRKRKFTIPNKGVFETTAQTAQAAKPEKVASDLKRDDGPPESAPT